MSQVIVLITCIMSLQKDPLTILTIILPINLVKGCEVNHLQTSCPSMESLSSALV